MGVALGQTGLLRCSGAPLPAFLSQDCSTPVCFCGSDPSARTDNVPGVVFGWIWGAERSVKGSFGAGVGLSGDAHSSASVALLKMNAWKCVYSGEVHHTARLLNINYSRVGALFSLSGDKAGHSVGIQPQWSETFRAFPPPQRLLGLCHPARSD